MRCGEANTSAASTLLATDGKFPARARSNQMRNKKPGEPVCALVIARAPTNAEAFDEWNGGAFQICHRGSSNDRRAVPLFEKPECSLWPQGPRRGFSTVKRQATRTH